MAGARLTLLIGDKGVCLAGRQLAVLYAEHHDQAGMQAVRQALAMQPQASVTLLIDSGAQDYRLETVPRLSALDRRQLVRRRLAQAFPDGALVASQPQKSGQILLAGLQDHRLVGPWIEFLHRRPTELGLLPVEGVTLLQRLKPAARDGWCLLLAPMRTGGLRQIVSRDGQLVFTRLTPAPHLNATPAAYAAAIAGDIRASLGYLARLGLTDSRELDALLLVPENWHAACAELDLPLRSLDWIAPAQAAAQLALPPAAEADELFALTQGKVKLRLAPATSATALGSLAAHDWGSRAAGGVCALAALLLLWPAAQLGHAMWQNHAQTLRLAGLQAALAAQQTSAAPVTEPLGRLRMALERQNLFTGDVFPWTSLQGLAQALGPDTRLVRLDWVSMPQSEDWQLAVQWHPAALQDPAALPEAAVARFRQLGRDLAQDLPGYAVDLTHLPYPALPNETVSNTHDANAPEVDDTALLSLRRAP